MPITVATISTIFLVSFLSISAMFSSMSVGDIIGFLGLTFMMSVAFLKNFRDNVKTKSVNESNNKLAMTKLLELEMQLKELDKSKLDKTFCTEMHRQSKENIDKVEKTIKDNFEFTTAKFDGLQEQIIDNLKTTQDKFDKIMGHLLTMEKKKE